MARAEEVAAALRFTSGIIPPALRARLAALRDNSCARQYLPPRRKKIPPVRVNPKRLFLNTISNAGEPELHRVAGVKSVNQPSLAATLLLDVDESLSPTLTLSSCGGQTREGYLASGGRPLSVGAIWSTSI